MFQTPKTRTFRRLSKRWEGRANNSLIAYQSTISGHGGGLFKTFSGEKEDDKGKVSKNYRRNAISGALYDIGSGSALPMVRSMREQQMVKRTFFVKAVWDAEAKVFYSESDIEGFHIEADTIDEFEDVIFDTAIDLIVANHMSLPDLADKPLRELIPAILWQRPEVPAAA